MASRMPDLYDLSHPDDGEVVRQAVRDHPSGVTPQYRCECRLRSRQGVWVWFTNDGRTMDSHTATPGRRLIVVKFNIDDRKRAWRSRTHSPACAIGARSCHSVMRSADAPRCRGRHRGPVRGQGVRDRVARDGQAGGLESRQALSPRSGGPERAHQRSGRAPLGHSELGGPPACRVDP